MAMGAQTAKYDSCADIGREAERLLDHGEAAAATVLHRRVAETCVFGPSPCPHNSECRIVIARVGRRLSGEE